MFKHTVTMRILSILLSLSMVLSTIGNGTGGFDCAANVTDAHTYFVGEIGMLVHNTCPAGNGGGTGQNQIQTGGANQYSTHESSNAAFRAAKRSANIPMSEQPAQVVQSLDRMGKAIPGKTYIFQNGTEIMQHSAGHIFEEGISSSAHFNILGSDWHFFYK